MWIHEPGRLTAFILHCKFVAAYIATAVYSSSLNLGTCTTSLFICSIINHRHRCCLLSACSYADHLLHVFLILLLTLWWSNAAGEAENGGDGTSWGDDCLLPRAPVASGVGWRSKSHRNRLHDEEPLRALHHLKRLRCSGDGELQLQDSAQWWSWPCLLSQASFAWGRGQVPWPLLGVVERVWDNEIFHRVKKLVISEA